MFSVFQECLESKPYISCESNQDNIQINVSLLDPVKTVKNKIIFKEITLPHIFQI